MQQFQLAAAAASLSESQLSVSEVDRTNFSRVGFIVQTVSTSGSPTMTANLQQSDTSGSGWENLTDPVTVASVPSNAKVEIFAKPTKRYVRVSVSEDAAGTLPLHASYYILDDGDTDIRIGTYVSGFPVRD